MNIFPFFLFSLKRKKNQGKKVPSGSLSFHSYYVMICSHLLPFSNSLFQFQNDLTPLGYPLTSNPTKILYEYMYTNGNHFHTLSLSLRSHQLFSPLSSLSYVFPFSSPYTSQSSFFSDDPLFLPHLSRSLLFSISALISKPKPFPILSLTLTNLQFIVAQSRM